MADKNISIFFETRLPTGFSLKFTVGVSEAPLSIGKPETTE